MRYVVTILWLLLSLTPAMGQVNVGIGISMPGVSIGINVPAYPQLVAVPGYPVYYAPSLGSNYFFYDGMYWVFQGDNWYASSWYNGPWGLVGPEVVPVFILRIPVRYYRSPPVYFRGWRPDGPPRWGDHWGHDWERRRHDWDRWDRHAVPRPAPLPSYQRQYSGNRYPTADQQHAIRDRNYRYQPREDVVRRHEQEQAVPRSSAPVPRGNHAESRSSTTPRVREENQRPIPVPHDGSQQHRVPAGQEQMRQPPQDPGLREQQPPRQNRRDVPQANPNETRRHQPQEKDHERGDERQNGPAR